MLCRDMVLRCILDCKDNLLAVGIVVDESTKSEALRKYDSWFQVTFKTGEFWDLQDRIFSMWERKEINGRSTFKERKVGS